MKNIGAGRKALLSIYQAGLDRVAGREAVYNHLEDWQGECSLVAIGKAAGAMVQGAIDRLGSQIIDGLVISKTGHLESRLLNTPWLETIESAHPVPDQRSLAAGESLLSYLAGLPEGRPLLFLISGGASSLVEVLRPGVGLEELEAINNWMLANGVAIGDMNRIRRSLSLIKGGGLISYLGLRQVQGLLISDVPKDDPAVIGSGLLVPPINKKGVSGHLKLPDWIRVLISGSDEGAAPSTGRADNINIKVIASLRDAREAAAEKARAMGYDVTLSHAHIGGDAVNAGRRCALELVDANPGVFIWGGEPSVSLPENPGRGGRNQHLALSAATVIAGCDDVCFLSIGTDGSDGPGDDAGALVDGGTLGRGEREGLSGQKSLDEADSGSFLDASGDLINTGPTGTNVMDLILGMKL